MKNSLCKKKKKKKKNKKKKKIKKKKKKKKEEIKIQKISINALLYQQNSYSSKYVKLKIFYKSASNLYV